MDWCRGRARTIAINNAFQLAPWADVLYAADCRWWGWHPEAYEFEGLKVSIWFEPRAKDYAPIRDAGVLCLRQKRNPDGTAAKGLSDEPDALVTGHNGGYQALNLAIHFGVSRILLLGYDMRVVDGRKHWHDDHPIVSDETVYSGVMLPAFKCLPPLLEARGVEVINCTPGSALDCFPRGRLEDVLT